VRDGKAVASIVVPVHALAVESYAARELQYHVERPTGTKLLIVPEGQETEAKSRVYLGKCVAAANIHLDPSSLSGNSYIIKSDGGDLYIVGQEVLGIPPLRAAPCRTHNESFHDLSFVQCCTGSTVDYLDGRPMIHRFS